MSTPAKPGLLQDNVVIVTGAGAGHGAAYVRQAVGTGACVVANDISAEGLSRLADELGERVYPVVSDVGQDGAALVKQALAQFGRLDAVVNNAAIAPMAGIAELDVDTFDEVVRVNLRGPYVTCKAAIEHWLEAGRCGRIVNVSSRTGLFATGGRFAAYSATKAGVVALTFTIAEEYDRVGITANVVCPRGWSHQRPRPDSGDAGRLEAFDPKHLGPPVMYLLSEQSSWCSGQVFAIDSDRLQWMQGWSARSGIRNGRPWSVDDMHRAFRRLVGAYAQMADEDKGEYAAVAGVAALGRPQWLDQVADPGATNLKSRSGS